MNALRYRSHSIPDMFFREYNDEGVLVERSPLDFIDDQTYASVIANYSLMNENSYDLELAKNDIMSEVEGPALAPAKQLAIVDNTGLTNYYLLGPGSSVVANDGDTIDIGGTNYYVIKTDASNPTEMQGIILTSGQVRMSGDLTFYGAIIAQDDIIVEGSQLVEVINDDMETQQYLAEMVLVNPKLYDVFDEDTNATIGIPMDEIEYIKDVVVATGNINSMRMNYDEFIFYQNWRIAE